MTLPAEHEDHAANSPDEQAEHRTAGEARDPAPEEHLAVRKDFDRISGFRRNPDDYEELNGEEPEKAKAERQPSKCHAVERTKGLLAAKPGEPGTSLRAYPERFHICARASHLCFGFVRSEERRVGKECYVLV